MKRNNFCLLLSAGILLVGYLLLTAGKTSVHTADYGQKVAASQQAARCFVAIRQLKEERQVAVDSANDINSTGLIGADYSAITTTLGNLEAKRTSTNPNMAAVFVDMFGALGLERGDRVALNCSGSFPALNIAAICAVESMGLRPVLISSFGSSTHGANDPGLTYQDMEHYLYEEGLISTKSDYFSIGGGYDIGAEMSGETKEEIVARIRGLGYAFLYDEDLIHNVRMRYELYHQDGAVKCLINVGGNDVAFGDSSVMVHAGGGILTELAEKDHSIGLIQLFLQEHIPVIHILNIKTLAADYGLPIDPSPIPAVGEGGVYRIDEYNRPLAAVVLLVGLLPLVPFVRNLRRRPDSPPQVP